MFSRFPVLWSFLLTSLAAPGAGAFPPVIDLASTGASVTVVGASENDQIARALCGGDFDRDGVADLAILWRRAVQTTTPPRVTILWRAQEIGPVVDLANPSRPVSVITTISGDAGNYSAMTCGDFNGDGADDLAIGIVNDSEFINFDGRAYIVFGRPGFPASVNLSSPADSFTTVLGVPGSEGWLGYSMTVGDVNGDGYDDLVISAWAYWPGGRVYVVYGRPSFPKTINLSSPAVPLTVIVDASLYQGTGVGLACADFNNDGFDDVLIGSPGNADGFYQGTVSLLYGANTLPSAISLSDETPGVLRLHGEYDDGMLGWRVGFGDINGDGRIDIGMTAPNADPDGCLDCGEIYAVFRNLLVPKSLAIASSSIAMRRYFGAGRVTGYGTELCVGDVDGDGCAEVIVKREPDRRGIDRREVVVAYGSAAPLDTVYLGFDSQVTHIKAEQPGDDLGRALAVYDLNGDGVQDLLVGAPRADGMGRVDAGKAMVFYGTSVATGVGRAGTPALVRLTNHPNPFSSSTTIELQFDGPARLSICDVRGRVVYATLVGARDRVLNYVWNAADESGNKLPSGVYFCRLDTPSGARVRKMVLVR